MDFDNPKVYGDTSITDGLVFQIYPIREVAGPENAAIQNLAAMHWMAIL